jgi:hypothetical protein
MRVSHFLLWTLFLGVALSWFAGISPQQLLAALSP